MEKEILLKEIENTNHLNDLYQLWNEFKAYFENQPSLLELGQLFDLIIIFKKNSIN